MKVKNDHRSIFSMLQTTRKMKIFDLMEAMFKFQSCADRYSQFQRQKRK